MRRRAARGPIRVAVVAPVSAPREGYVVYRDSRRAAAGRRLQTTLEALRGAGIPAYGGVFEDEPLTAVKDVLAARARGRDHRLDPPGDEVRLDAEEPPRRDPEGRGGPPRRARRLGRGGPRGRERPRRRERDRPRRPAARAHPAAGAGRPRELPHRLAAERSERTRAPRGRATPPRRARRSSAPRASTRTATIAQPDPYTAAINAVEDERVDEIIVSTFPGERSGWLRRDLVGRLRSDTGLTVDHVVAEPAAVEGALERTT